MRPGWLRHDKLKHIGHSTLNRGIPVKIIPTTLLLVVCLALLPACRVVTNDALNSQEPLKL